MHWLHPIVGGEAARWILLLLVIVTLAGFVAIAPRRWPGPITSNERAEGSAWSRIEGWARLVFAVAAWLAILLAIAPVSCSHVGVLHSRARSRGDAVKWSVRQRWDGGTCSASHDDGVDLGPPIDSALQAIHVTGVTSANDYVRAMVREQLRTARLAPASSLAGDPVAPATISGQVPKWLIESVEMSTVMEYVTSHNVSHLLVAAAATRDVSAWRALGATLAARGVELCLVSPKVIDSEVRIRKLAFVRWLRPSSGAARVTFWALIEGKLKQPARLHVKIDNDGPRELELPVDASEGRLVFVCVGACSTMTAGIRIEDAKLANRSAPATSLAAIEATGELGVVARIDAAKDVLRARPGIEIDDGARAKWWADLLDSSETLFDRDAIAEELDAFGWELPTLAAKTADVRLAEEPGRIVIWRGDRQSGSVTKPTASAARVAEAHLGVNTVQSLLATPVTQVESPSPLAATGAPASAGVQVARFDAEPKPVSPQVGIVEVTASTKGRVVTIALDAERVAEDPIALGVLVRTVAYATAWVADPAFDDVVGTSDERDDGRIEAAPLLREEDLLELRARQAFPWDVVAVVLLGIHLWLAARHSRR